ncbi:MAG TPA: MBL fold metallo-hydrolase [Gemmataceae bacterium]|nr:MBL fold metallo-hydrolase [Gemmataceae bacterium]
MSMRFTVLASGSGGNASLLEAGGFGLLLDAGLGPRQLAARLAAAGTSWNAVHALLLTHTHSDHWHDRTFAQLRRRNLPLYCHAGHHDVLQAYSPAFSALRTANLIRLFDAGQEFDLAPGLRCRPLAIRHDGGATFGFRFEGAPDLFGGTCSLAYLADLGSWDADLASSLADVDALALEFNHDVALEYGSGRSARLIARVVGDEGHLSNEQAAGLLREVLRSSTPGRLKHVVQLHLSRDCNRPDLALAAARAILEEHKQPAEVHTASQDEAGATLHIGGAPEPRRRRRAAAARQRRQRSDRAFVQPWLPGWEADEASGVA